MVATASQHQVMAQGGMVDILNELGKKAKCGDYAPCGCEVSHCCHQCPLEICILDVPLVTQVRRVREAQVTSFKRLGFSNSEIASMVGLSKRSISRLTCETNQLDNHNDHVLD